MKIINKIKNFFYDDEDGDEGATKVATAIPKKPEPTPPVAMRENVDDIVSERELFKSESTFKFPIIFEDDDLETKETPSSPPRNVIEIEKAKLKAAKPKPPEAKKFAPTPIISPVYGVLGQNYTAGEKPNLDDNLLNLYQQSAPVDIDVVIGKAYGRTQQEPPTTTDSELDLFKDIVEPPVTATTPPVTETEQEETTRLQSIDDLLASTDEQDFYKLVDQMYEDEKQEEDVES